MSYKKLIEKVVAEHNTTTEEVEVEIRSAIRAAGYDMEPKILIALAVSTVNSKSCKEKTPNSLSFFFR